jgi:hypothetical protein
MLVSELAFESEWVLKAITNQLRRRILYLIKDFKFMICFCLFVLLVCELSNILVIVRVFL